MGKESKAQGYAERLAVLRKTKASTTSERDARDLRELDDPRVQELLADETNVVVRFKDAPPDMPGHYIGCRPSGPAIAFFKQTMWKDSAQKGVIEAKARAGEHLASQCRLYPSAEDYARLVAEFPLAPDRISKALIEAAEGGAEAEGND